MPPAVTPVTAEVVTHFHPDHAGLVEEIKHQGATFLLHTCQAPFMAGLDKFFKPGDHFTPISAHGNVTVSSPESQVLLNGLGLKGELLPTPGHSDDSISLIIDGECAFTGDLPGPALAGFNPQIGESWERIMPFRVTKAYPGHGNPVSL